MSLAGYISPRELKDLLISLAALVIAFSVLIGGRSIPGLEMILIIALGVGSGLFFMRWPISSPPCTSATWQSTGPI